MLAEETAGNQDVFQILSRKHFASKKHFENKKIKISPKQKSMTFS